MLRRALVIATIVGLGGLFGGGAAEAHRRDHASGKGQCVAAAAAAKKSCEVGCVDTFRTDFETCFGPGSGCAQTCLTARLSCQSNPDQAIHACVGDLGNPQSCRSQLKVALAACKSDPDPVACVSRAQLDALKCRQACVDAQEPALELCQAAFRLCLRGCPSSPGGAFLDLDR
ncbi:MAG TPA: hypothetical protein VKW76_00105 [Candidatus Binatia bacterium]|nr:hypothetical protein [Candidatus Binatia bacterium]